MIRVQQQDFSVEHERLLLLRPGDSGACVTFVGHVRRFSDNPQATFLLQHYPGMTEKVLQKIEQQAQSRWKLDNTCIIHRVGELKVGEQIVFVGVSSPHRAEAFAACEFMIDILKTEAPFWKKEGDQWVEARDSDNKAAEKWMR